jgi:hypothetical protein
VCASLRIAAPLIVITACMTSLAGCGGGSSSDNADSSGAENALASIPGFTVAASGGPSTPASHVVNNAAPVATVNEEFLILNTDQRAGIPIPYTVSDRESDEVQVVFQWKRSSEVEFPPLPNTPAEIDAILADPEQRREKHICTEYPTWALGRVVPIDSDSVRLPELATSAASILAHGLIGRELEILRSSKAPEPTAATWASNPLNRPVAAMPIGDGIEALVLDRASVGAWRLRQIDLATGVVTRVLVPAAPGEPNAMTLERGEESVLVASAIAGAWRLARVNLADGALTPLIAFDGSTESGPIRGLASEGSNSALVTVASSLIRLEFSDAAPARSVTIFDDLSTPWGVAIDPLNTHRIYLAEREADTVDGTGRILSIQLDTLERRPIVARVEVLDDVYEYAFPLPQALALDRSGHRLLAITQREPSDGTWELTSIDLGGALANRAFRLLSELPTPAASIATGANDLLVLALAAERDLYVRGGVEQRRTVEQLELAHQAVHVSESFAPALTATALFRVRISSLVVRASPSGTRGTFVWDSADVPDGGPVQFRAVPMDAAVGVEGSTEAAELIRSALDTEPVAVGNWIVTSGARSVVAADLDGDGDLDLASAHPVNDTLTVFFQESPGVLGTAPLSLGNSSVTDLPLSVTAADFDGDGDSDLASANAESDTLTIFFQESPGVFGSTPLTLGDASVTDYPYSVTAADFDGDGDFDLASANAFGHTLTVFFQESPGVFGSIPLSLGGIGVTTRPVCVVGADIDGDGDLDLASANWRSHTLTIFFQTSPGVFGSTPLSLGDPSVLSYPSSVIAADLDGDGDLDLASANDGSRALTIFFQESPGVFGVTPLSLGAQSETFDPLSVTAADLDADGDLDLATANYLRHTITVFFQESPGVFGATPLSLGDTNTSGTFSSPTCVIAADLDGDGGLDLVSANEEGDTLNVFFQSSPGVFGSTPLLLATEGGPIPPECVASGDLDGDGDLDLVSANGAIYGDTLNVFFQESPGVFGSTPLSLGNASVTNVPTSVTAADLDGDGDLDLASANWGSNTLTVFFQTGPGVYGPTPLSLATASATNGPVSVAAADLDGDGDLDLVSANAGAHTLTVFFQVSPGVFGSTPLSVGGFGVTSWPYSVTAADLDGDGDFDLASANLQGDQLTVFFQESPGVFGSTPLFLGNASVTDGPQSVTAADLDGDGDLDLASANWRSSTLTVFFQTSPGVFGATPLLLGNASVTNQPVSVTAADFDGDGDSDLASANAFGSTLTVFFQTSPGDFGATPLSLGNASVTLAPVSVAAADLDGDGDLDLMSANQGSRTLTVFWNNH